MCVNLTRNDTRGCLLLVTYDVNECELIACDGLVLLRKAIDSFNCNGIQKQRHVTLFGITRNDRRCHLCPGRKSLKSRVPKGHVAVGQGRGAHARNVARQPEAVKILDMSWAYGAARTRCGRPRIEWRLPSKPRRTPEGQCLTQVPFTLACAPRADARFQAQAPRAHRREYRKARDSRLCGNARHPKGCQRAFCRAHGDRRSRRRS